MKKVMFISSMGGHLTELLKLKDIFKNYNYKIITEKHPSTMWLKKKYINKVNYLFCGTKDHILKYLFIIPLNIIKSIYLFLKFKPDIVITTGAHTCVMMCYLAKIFKKKIIYIETFANITTKTLSGRLVYPISDIFVVQWKSMKKLYPKAVYGGWIF